MHIRYFSKTTLNHFKPQQGLSERYQRRAIDVTLDAKLTLTYGKYHLAMLHRQLAMSEEQTTYQQGRIDHNTFCQEFQELSWMNGKRIPLDGKRLKMYIMSMREVVVAYKKLLFLS
jgi:hypothetical protein